MNLHVRRYHRRHVVARTQTAGASHHSAERRVPSADVGIARLGIARGCGGSGCIRSVDEPVGDEGARTDRGAPQGVRAISSGSRVRSRTQSRFYEKGDRPLEIVTSRQWFIKTMDSREELLARGSELQWHPEFMRHRYDNWVNGLSGDWCVSRQRFFGVPFPVWYPDSRRRTNRLCPSDCPG
jgi:hypothetical protein